MIGHQSIPLHLQARKRRHASKQFQPIPVHPNSYALLATNSFAFAEYLDGNQHHALTKSTVRQPIPNPNVVSVKSNYNVSSASKRNAKRNKYNGKKRSNSLTVQSAVKHKYTELAKSDDKLCPFKQAVDTKEILQCWQKAFIIQEGKNVGCLLGRKFFQAQRFLKHCFDSHIVRFCGGMKVARYQNIR